MGREAQTYRENTMYQREHLSPESATVNGRNDPEPKPSGFPEDGDGKPKN